MPKSQVFYRINNILEVIYLFGIISEIKQECLLLQTKTI